ncbi:MAG: hypothetical protein ACQESD_01755 [Thermoplasmatota archaeon]
MILPSHPVMFIDVIGDLMVASAFGCCLLLFVIVISTLTFFRKKKTKKNTSQYCEQCGAPIGRWDSQCERCGSSTRDEQNDHSRTSTHPSYTVVDSKRDDFSRTRKTKKTKRKSFSFFKKEKVCQECGTELVYREAYDSYYCPECRTYR